MRSRLVLLLGLGLVFACLAAVSVHAGPSPSLQPVPASRCPGSCIARSAGCAAGFRRGLCPGTAVCCPSTGASPAGSPSGSASESSSVVRGQPLAATSSQGGQAFARLNQPQAVWAVGGRLPQVNWGPNLGVVVAYNIPGRDAGQYSAGGTANEQSYLAWVQSLAQTIGSARTAVILEPDAIPQSAPGQAAAATRPARIRMLSQAIQILKRNPNTAVYVDVGHSRWLSCQAAASALNSLTAAADGFSINVSNYVPTDESVTWGKCVAAAAKKNGRTPHFVVDVSRNGGTFAAGQWCNVPSAGLGRNPTTNTGDALVDAYLWIKRPGESDGNCNGAPNAGTFSPQLAQKLIQNSRVQA